MDGHDKTDYTDSPPSPALNPAAPQALEKIDKHTLLTGTIGTAAFGLVPGKRKALIHSTEAREGDGY